MRISRKHLLITLELGGLVEHICGTLTLYSVQCHLGVIQCTCLKVPCNSKTAKQIEVWDSWDVSLPFVDFILNVYHTTTR